MLADKSEGATDRQSRNGAGKTSFIELVHFLTGGQVRKGNIFNSETLRDNTFRMMIDVGIQEVMVERTGSSSGKIRVDRQIEDWSPLARPGKNSGVLELSNANWCEILGVKWFDLNTDQTQARFNPS
ncbi:MAG: DUF2326 domain-containing protein, partial [Gammaproteobacteria bacterium]|nr:DUF2326 domain-containing protein [Gammaproteobacteria bacterium]